MKHLFTILALAALSACSGMGTKYDAHRAGTIKKVVILALEIQQQQPKDGLGLSGADDLKEGTTVGDSAPLKKTAAEVYQEFTRALNEKTRWPVVPLAGMKNNEKFSEVFHAKMDGARQVSVTSLNGTGNVQIIFADGVLDQTAFRKMSHAEQAALAKSFGADAFGELMLFQSIEQGFSLGNLTGSGDFSFQTRANLRLFGMDSEDPIWQIQNVDGQSSFNSKSLPEKMPKRQKLALVGLESAKSAVHKLVDTFPGMYAHLKGINTASPRKRWGLCFRVVRPRTGENRYGAPGSARRPPQFRLAQPSQSSP